MLSITNPRSILFYVSFFIQFIDPATAQSAVAFSHAGHDAAAYQPVLDDTFIADRRGGCPIAGHAQAPGQAGQFAHRPAVYRFCGPACRRAGVREKPAEFRPWRDDPRTIRAFYGTTQRV